MQDRDGNELRIGDEVEICTDLDPHYTIFVPNGARGHVLSFYTPSSAIVKFAPGVVEQKVPWAGESCQYARSSVLRKVTTPVLDDVSRILLGG